MGSEGPKGDTGAMGPEGKAPQVNLTLSPYSQETALKFNTQYEPSASSPSEVVLTLSWDPGQENEEEWSGIVRVGETQISTVYLKDLRSTGQESWSVSFPVPADKTYLVELSGNSKSVELHGSDAIWTV